MIYLFKQLDAVISYHQENVELKKIPPNPQTNCSAAVPSTENLDYNDDEEADSNSFTTDKLFSFAWQIARGMVMYYRGYFMSQEVNCHMNDVKSP